MIKIENVDVYGWEAALRGLRNPMNSWAKSDSYKVFAEDQGCGDAEGKWEYVIGEKDLDLCRRMNVSTEQSKYRRMITVTADITAPLYWWKEADTYKVGTVCNSCSTMHKISAKEVTLDDFSFDHVNGKDEECTISLLMSVLNTNREKFIATKNKQYWWNMIQLLPSSYNQRRTIQLNYEVLASMYRQRKKHKLDEWREFCKWIETLPYAKGVICNE